VQIVVIGSLYIINEWGHWQIGPDYKFKGGFRAQIQYPLMIGLDMNHMASVVLIFLNSRN